MDVTGLEKVEFGTSIREKEFCLRKNTVHLNHGSYGAVPKRVLKLRSEWSEELEDNPDLWFRRDLFKHWQNAKNAICNFVNVKDTACLVFLPNATTGTNAVLKSLKYKKGDIILATNFTYQAVKNLIQHVIDTIEVVDTKCIDISLPVKSKEEIVNLYADYIKNNPNIKIAVIDFITSPSSILMPVKEIVEVCKQNGILTLIDGAHSPGQIHLDLEDLGADFFVGNLHKWLFTPRGCAILYVAKEHVDKIHSLCTSWHHNEGLDIEFLDNGTKDHTPFICSMAGLEFFNRIGGFEKITNYNRTLIREGREYIMKAWGTEKQEIPEELEAPFMVNIKLPQLKDYEVNSKSSFKLQMDLLENQNITSVMVTYLGVNYCRLSCQVYNTIDDFIKLGDAVKRLMK